MLIAAGIYAGTNGIDLPILIFSAIPLSVFIASSILFPRAYKRYVKQEQAKEWAKTTATAMYSRYQETRTDMLNTEEDD